MCSSMSEKEIAKAMGVKQSTVKAMKYRLYIRYQIFDGCKRVKLAVARTKELECLS